jgi:branched-chain amino acid aminotransferase
MNRGFLYGDGFFETIRIIDNQIPLLAFHLERIGEAIEIYQLQPSYTIDEDFINAIKSNCEKNGILRINFFRDGHGKYLPDSNDLAFDYAFSPTNLPFFAPTSLDIVADLKNAPIAKGKIALYQEPKPNVRWLTVKSLSSIFYVLAAKYKEEQSADYLLIQNSDGNICEELVSNLLLQTKEGLLTPSIKCGGVYGATLRFLLKNYGFDITEKAITLEDIETAEAVYSCKGSSGVIRIK